MRPSSTCGPMRMALDSVDEIEHLEKDDKFQSLHGDPRFDALVAATRQRIAAAKTQPATR